MPRYLYLLRNSVEPSGAPMSAEERDEMIRSYQAWAADLGDRLIMGERLTRDRGRVARRNGKTLETVDGPYAETKEIAAGFWLIEADDLDHAERSAEGLPFGKGRLEIREIQR